MTTFLLHVLQDNLLASHLTSRDLSAMDLDTACFIHHDAYVLNLNPFSGSNLSTARMRPNVPSNKEKFKDIHFVSQSVWTSERCSTIRRVRFDIKCPFLRNSITIQPGMYRSWFETEGSLSYRTRPSYHPIDMRIAIFQTVTNIIMSLRL